MLVLVLVLVPGAKVQNKKQTHQVRGDQRWVSQNGIRWTIWNTKREGGWETYFSLNTVNNKLNRLAQSEVEDSEEAVKSLEKEMKNVKYQSFGKVSVNKSKKQRSTVDKIFNEEGKN